VSGGAEALAAIGRAVIERGMSPLAIGLFAKDRARSLRAEIARAFPVVDDPAELFEDDACGRPRDAMLKHSRYERIASGADIERAATEFTAIIAHAGGFAVSDDFDRKFLARRQREIMRGLALDISCRARSEPLPPIAWLHEAAAHYSNYKERFGLVDAHDLDAAAFWSERSIRLLLLDDIGADDCARLIRIFPGAAMINSIHHEAP